MSSEKDKLGSTPTCYNNMGSILLYSMVAVAAGLLNGAGIFGIRKSLDGGGGGAIG